MKSLMKWTLSLLVGAYVLFLLLGKLPSGEGSGPPQPFESLDMSYQEINQFYWDCKDSGRRVVLINQNTKLECRENVKPSR